MKSRSLTFHPPVSRFIIRSLVLFITLTGGCTTIPHQQIDEQILPLTTDRERAEYELLNVSLRVLDPGQLPADPEKRSGLAPEIREAETRFAPVRLKHTLQRTGYWGVVRVVPDQDIAAELLVSGTIVLSDGESTVLEIEAVDARNVVWFKRTYAQTSRPEEHLDTDPETQDTFQDLFNAIANDLALYRNSLTTDDIEQIRNLAAIKYARAVASGAFDGYLSETAEGRIQLERLPAEQDPVMERVYAVKVRDEMLVDIINDYYDIYYRDLREPYRNWRRHRQEGVSELRRLERNALGQQLIGITAIVGAIALGAATDDETSVQSRPVLKMLLADETYSVYSSFKQDQRSQVNEDVIEELGQSFDYEAKPLTIEVEDKTVKLIGSAEEQYARWRIMLRNIYAKKTGLVTHSPSEHGTTEAPAEALQ